MDRPEQKKRSITDARREQTRNAQRRYRERQKLRLQELSASTSRTVVEPPIAPGHENLENGPVAEEETSLSSSNALLDESLSADFFSVDLPEDTSIALQELYTPQEDSTIFSGSHQPTSFEASYGLALGSPLATCIRIPKVSLHVACTENAKLIGVAIARLRNHRCGSDSLPSPFYRPLPQPSYESPLRPNSNLKADLQPCELQIMHPHELYIDTVPFPAFRERALALLTLHPPAFDEAELIHDIDSGAWHCWGNAPWDSKSWEVEAWFLRKWWMLTGTEQGPLGEQSRWWREMRGEAEDQ